MVMMNGNYSEMIFPAYLGEILGLYWPGLGLEQKIDHNEPVWEMRWSFREPGGGGAVVVMMVAMKAGVARFMFDIFCHSWR